jgi:hypothetical protein
LRDEGGSRTVVFLSEEAQCGRPLGKAPLLGTLEDMLRKALDMGICLHRGEKDSISGFLLWTHRTVLKSVDHLDLW